jgi:peptidoglycan/LPS O-acetylase OafA/YrhL
MGKRLTVAQHHRRWAIWTSAVICLGAFATGVVAFALSGTIDPEPWGYIAFMVAVLSALACMFFAYAMAAIESRGD